jgi:hypothetical protein
MYGFIFFLFLQERKNYTVYQVLDVEGCVEWSELQWNFWNGATDLTANIDAADKDILNED